MCKANNRHPPNTFQMSPAFLLHECKTTVGWRCSRQDSGFANVGLLCPEHRSENLVFKVPFSDPHFPPCDLFTPSQSDTAVSTAALPVSEGPAESSLLYRFRSGALRKHTCCIPIISPYDGHCGHDFFLPVETKATYGGKGLVSAHSLKDRPSGQARVMSGRV